MKKLYIHIGTGKTGTTFIQNFLLNNNKILRGNFSTNYCETGLTGENHLALCSNSPEFHFSTKTHEILSQRLRKLLIEINDSPCEQHVISSEYFPGITKNDIAFYHDALASHVDLHIIVYLRRQDHYLDSWYSQELKSGSNWNSIHDLKHTLIKEGFFDYYTLINSWSSIIDEGNIHVRAFEKKQFIKNNLIFDFLNIISINEYNNFYFDNNDMKKNKKITRDQALIIKVFRDLGLNYLIELSKIDEPLEKINVKKAESFLSPEERVELINYVSDSNMAVARRFLHRPDGQLFYEPLPNPDIENWTEIKSPSYEYLIATFASLINEALQHK